jgi:hypothetical protein
MHECGGGSSSSSSDDDNNNNNNNNNNSNNNTNKEKELVCLVIHLKVHSTLPNQKTTNKCKKVKLSLCLTK